MYRDEELRALAVRVAQHHVLGYDPQAPMRERAAVVDPLVAYLIGDPKDEESRLRRGRAEALYRVEQDRRMVRGRDRVPVREFVDRCREMESYLSGRPL